MALVIVNLALLKVLIMGLDNRGSEEQRIIYRFLCQLYPTCDVIYEAQLPNGTRYDCFVKQMGIVIELDGVDAPLLD